MANGTFQKFFCVARISQDLELKYIPSGAAVLSFSAATNEKYKDKDGNYQEKAEFHRLVAWNKNAENIAKYFEKGSRIFIEGKLETRQWEKDGQKHYTTEIKVDKWDFVDSAKKQETNKPQQSEPVQDDDSELPF